MKSAWMLGVVLALICSIGTAEAAAVKEGDPAPEVGTVDEAGKPVKLSDFKGKGVVLFFYPKADTPGCTAESCGFRDAAKEYEAKGYVLLGASRDTPAAQAAFKTKYNLPYALLSDPKGELAESLGFKPGARSTAIINKDGKVEKLIVKGGTATHAKDLLVEIK